MGPASRAWRALAQVVNHATPGLDLDPVLAERIAAGDTPDLYEQSSWSVPSFIEKNGADSLYPLNDFLASRPNATSNLNPELLAELTIDGKIYGVPAGFVARVNALYYNKHIFKAHQLNPPTTLDEFRTVCQKPKAAGVSPLPGGHAGSLLEAVLPPAMGHDAYYNFRANRVPDEEGLRKGIDLFLEMVDDYLGPRLQETAFEPHEMDAFMDGRTGMFLSGEWTKPMLQQLGWTPGVDFGVIPAPGNAGLFTYNADVFTVPAGAPHLEAALDFLDTVVSLDGQRAFAEGDVTPVRSDVLLGEPDPVRQSLIEDWRNAEYRLTAGATVYTGVPMEAIDAFIQSTPRDKEAFLQLMLVEY
ncbi:ABC transporter substrate-binding protein [Myxococcota bacterium]